MVSLKVLETDAELNRRIIKTMANAINARFPQAVPRIKARAKTKFVQLFQNTNEYRSLNDGLLATHLGIWKGQGYSKANVIIDTVINAMEVTYTPLIPSSNVYRGGMTISIIRSNLEEVFTYIDKKVIETFYYSQTFPEGIWLPWAEWLLLRGDDIIVSTHHINIEHGGRSGNAVMLEGGSWRVPPQFSGIASNNWLTRAITEQSQVFSKLVGHIMIEELF